MSADAVFTKLSLVYGKRFVDSLGGADPATVRAHWAHELRGYRSEAIAHGLANLPQSFPPTVLEFGAICRQWSPQPAKQLPAPKACPSVVERAQRRMDGLTSRMQRNGTDAKEWARKLRKRHELGDNLTRFQIDAYRAVLEKPVLHQEETEVSNDSAPDASQGVPVAAQTGAV